MIITTKMSGFAEWERILFELAARNTVILSASMRAAAESIVEHVKERTPVGPPPVHMRDTVQWTSTDHSSDVAMSALAVVGNQASMFVTIDSYYAHFVEFGTSRMPAQPFFRPALDEAMDIAAARLEQEARDTMWWIIKLAVAGPGTLAQVLVQDVAVPVLGVPKYAWHVANALA